MNSQGQPGSELSAFLAAAKEHGLSDEFVVSLLKENGWPERTVYRAYSSFYSNVVGLQLPTRGPSTENAKDAFLYILNFITLGFWTVALGQIFYSLIQHWFPDPTQMAYYGGTLRAQTAWQLATVIVAFPVFAFVHGLINRELRSRPELYDSGIRRWLTYLALVIAAVIVITDAVWFIDALIVGELTMRFILDSIVLLVLGGGVFAYYLTTLDRGTAIAAPND